MTSRSISLAIAEKVQFQLGVNQPPRGVCSSNADHALESTISDV